jgi:hypothetical protein
VGLREKINENKTLATVITIAILVIAMIAILIQVFSSSNPANAPGQVYFTADDGATFFADSAEKIPPYTQDEKTFYGARVFQCEDGTRFVGVMERYTPAAKTKLDAFFAAKVEERDFNIPSRYDNERYKEVKKPGTGDAGWVPAASPAGQRVLQVPCPDGKGEAIQVQPGQ